jgi:hypothetical protein
MDDNSSSLTLQNNQEQNIASAEPESRTQTQSSSSDKDNSIHSQAADGTEAVETNSALEKIPNFEEMPEDCLLGVKWYGKDFKWTEINAIANLVRYNITEDPYFLFVPRYAGSRITISISGNVPDQILYSEERCTDDFGIIINQKFIEPNDPPLMRVTVSYGGDIAYYDFVKDGPSVINCPVIENGTFYSDNVIFPQQDLRRSQGAFFAETDYGHSGRGDFILFSGDLPVDWESGETTAEAQHYRIYAKEIDDYTGNVKIWGYYCTGTSGRTVMSFLTNLENTAEMETAQGNKVYRANTNQSILMYSFMANDTLAVVVELSTTTGACSLYTAQVTDLEIMNFCDSFAVLKKVQGDYKDPVPVFD